MVTVTSGASGDSVNFYFYLFYSENPFQLVYPPGGDPTSQAINAIHDALSKLPNVCSFTVGGQVGVGGRASVGGQYNTQTGFAGRGRVTLPFGPYVGGRVTVTSDPHGGPPRVSTSVRVGGTVGATLGFEGNNITSVGASARYGPAS